MEEDPHDRVELNPSKRFVRLRGRRDGFIEFDFAVGEPEIFLEMILTPEAFEEFCAMNRVTMLPPADPNAPAQSDWDWRLADATHFD